MSGMSASIETPVETRARRVPLRTCVACRTTGGKRGLLRVVRLPEQAGESQTNRVVLDRTGKRSGRGAYVCARLECVEQALKQKKLERSLRISIAEELAQALRESVGTSGEVMRA
jgi:uncharacterized protein